MDIKGSQKIKATQQEVFQALQNSNVLKNSIPGCDEAETIDSPAGRQLKLRVSPSIPGLKGPYTVLVQLTEQIAPSHLVLIANPVSSIGSVTARCVIDLTQEAEHTLLSYNAHANITGKISATPEIILKGAIKVALDQFFKNFEKQVRVISA